MYVDELIRYLTKINDDHRNDTFWIAGNLNLPDIDWKTMTYSSNHNSLNSKIIDLTYDLGIEQTIHFPTRKTKTLDIFFTNYPSTLLSAKPLSSLGDHDIILAEIKIKPDRLRPTKREIPLWKKVDIVKFKIEAMKAVNILMAKEINNIEESWATFKYCLHTVIQKHVPSKLSSTKYTNPWANTNISHLAKKKDRLFMKAKHSGRETHWAKCREVRSIMQRKHNAKKS